MKFAQLSEYFSELETTASRNVMVEILSQLFQQAQEEEVDKICYLLQGRVLPLFEPVEFGLADRMMIKALSRAFNMSEEQINQTFKQKGDMGLVAEELRRQFKNSPQALSVKIVYEKLLEIALHSGTGSVEKKIVALSLLFQQLDELSCRYIARIPLNKLRLGFSDMTMLDSLSWMLAKSKKERPIIEAAYNVRPDLGFIAQSIKKSGLTGIKKVKPVVGTPILMTRAERLSSGEEIVNKIGNCAIEYKYDGFRLQVHYGKNKNQEVRSTNQEKNLELFYPEQKEFVRLFSRNLEDVTAMYPDVVKGVIDQIDCDEAIFEGEAIAYNPKTNQFLPFQETTQRRRKYDISQKAEEIPLRLVTFEILYLNGESLLEQPYESRRKKLEEIFKNPEAKGKKLKTQKEMKLEQKKLEKKTVVVSEIQVSDRPDKIDEIFTLSVKKGLEGIMAKRLDGVYQAGARGWNWIKYKKSYNSQLEDTIDAVVMGYDFGQGKRQGFGIGDFLIGVYEKKSDKFLTVAKIGTGLTDDEWKNLKELSIKYQVSSMPKRYVVDKKMHCDVWLEPKLVVEILADEITKSPVHTAGLALRFPRLKTFRQKQPEDTTTVDEIKKMFLRQGH